MHALFGAWSERRSIMAKSGSSGGKPADKKQMIKAVAAVALILGTGVWLAYYNGLLGGDDAPPPAVSPTDHLDDADKKAAEELMRRKQELDLKRPPAGS